jgi:small-conductance mechanosensitive channel
VRGLVESFGVTWPNSADWISAVFALIVAAACLGAAWLAGRQLGPRLAAFWERRAGAHAGGLGQRMCALLRHGLLALLMMVALAVEPWRPLGAILLGLVLAWSAATFLSGFVRGIGLPRWAAALVAIAAFVALLARALGGLDPLIKLLDRTGFDVGSTRISALSILHVLLTLVALYAVATLLNRVISHSIRRAQGLDPTQQLLAQKLAAIAILAAAFFIGLDLTGIDLTALAVFSGAFGLAVGFGLQKTFGNLIAGIILLMDRSIKPGDVIAVGDTFGHVSKIGVRAVSVVTRDGKEHLIPNEILMTEPVENWSYSSRDVRVHIKVGVAYDCDLPLAQKLMVEAASGAERVLDTPAPRVWLTAFGDNAVEHEILAWIGDPEGGVGSVRSEVLNRLWRLFRENGIDIPYPQRDIHVKDWPAPPSTGPKA